MPVDGHYPIERRRGEIERLEMQSAAIAADAEIMLDRIGVAEGWSCIDIGCGPGTMIEALGRRVGARGRVVALDADPVFIEHVRRLAEQRGLRQVEAVTGDAYRSELPRASFDLVHARFVASTTDGPEALVREAVALAKPGGCVAFQEPDFATLACHPAHPAYSELARLLEAAFVAVGCDVRLGQRLFGLLRSAGLEHVEYRPSLVGFRSSDPMSDFVPASIESVKQTLIDRAIVDERTLDQLLHSCRAHLRDPGTVTTYLTVVQSWGRR